MSDLTIVLPAYGRKRFTDRFAFNASKLPFLLELDVRGERLLVREYFEAIRNLVHGVNTPYAMLCDNDDLPTEALSRCVDFLDINPDYVCASGRIQGFYMWPDLVTGPHSAVVGQYSPYDTPANYNQDDISERVLAGFANSWSYYGVYRTEALLQIWRDVVSLDLTNLQVHEKFCAMRTLTLGKAICFGFDTTLYRQHGTSQGAVWTLDPGIDMLKVLTVMAAEGVDRDALQRAWAAWYETRDRQLHSPLRKTLKAAFPTLAWYVQNRHRYLPHRSLPI